MKQESKNIRELLRIILIVAATCLVHGTMQGVHDNYGIMMTGLIPVTGIDYAGISFCIGTGALVYGFAQPFLGMIALKKSNTFVILLGIFFTVTRADCNANVPEFLFAFSLFWFWSCPLAPPDFVSASSWAPSHRFSENAGPPLFPVSYRQAQESETPSCHRVWNE